MHRVICAPLLKRKMPYFGPREVVPPLLSSISPPHFATRPATHDARARAHGDRARLTRVLAHFRRRCSLCLRHVAASTMFNYPPPEVSKPNYAHCYSKEQSAPGSLIRCSSSHSGSDVCPRIAFSQAFTFDSVILIV